jgi:hypothetical protein
MSKLLALAVVSGALGACTLGFIPSAPGKNEIARFCRSEGHQIGTDAYTACLEDEANLALVQDIVRRNGGVPAL